MRNRGFTVLEISVVLAIAAIHVALATPTLAGLLAIVQTDAAARRLSVALAAARATAVMRSRHTVLTVDPDSLVIRVIAGADSSVAWSAAGPRAEGVTLTGPNRPVAFGPNRLATGASNATFRLARGATVRQVVVSRLGRVWVLRSP